MEGPGALIVEAQSSSCETGGRYDLDTDLPAACFTPLQSRPPRMVGEGRGGRGEGYVCVCVREQGNELRLHDMPFTIVCAAPL